MMLTVDRVSKFYGPVKALTDLAFELPQGCILGLLGQNGAGKTTALNILTGYLSPDSGTVLVDGHDMARDPRAAKRLIGYLPEKPPLYDEMTVEEYLCFAADLKGVVKSDIRRHVDEVMACTGLSELRDRLVGHLSKGFRQRAGLAQALCGDPPVLVLDEPTVGLDPRQVVEIRDLMTKLGETHTVIFSSHLLGEVQQVCQRAVILHEGKTVLSGSMKELTNRGEENTLRVSIAGSQNELFPKLNALPFVTHVQLLSHEQPGVLEARLSCTEHNPAALFDFCRKNGYPLLRLQPGQTPLEEVFLQVTAGNE